MNTPYYKLSNKFENKCFNHTNKNLLKFNIIFEDEEK